MPTILRQFGFNVVIYVHDHLPPHVHVVRGDIQLAVDIQTLAIRDENGPVKAQDRRQARHIVSEHAAFLLKKWTEYHG